jgi:hypothetical protein
MDKRTNQTTNESVRPEPHAQGGLELGDGDQVGPALTPQHRPEGGVVEVGELGHLPESAAVDGGSEAASDFNGIERGSRSGDFAVRPVAGDEEGSWRSGDPTSRHLGTVPIPSRCRLVDQALMLRTERVFDTLVVCSQQEWSCDDA